jgi:hypothetical protein
MGWQRGGLGFHPVGRPEQAARGAGGEFFLLDLEYVAKI